MRRAYRYIGSLAATLACLSTGHGLAATLTLGNVAGSPGGRVSVPVSYSGEAASQIQFSFALNQSAPAGSPGLIADLVPNPIGAPIVDLNADAGISATALAQAADGALKDGDQMTLELVIPPKATLGTVYTLALTDVEVTGAQGPVKTEGVNGSVSVKGDATGTPQLAELKIVPDLLAMVPGDTEDLRVEGTGSDKQPFVVGAVDWKIDHPEIATIDANGTVTAISPGSATISAVSGNVVANATVKVEGPGGQAPPTTLTAASVTTKPGTEVEIPLTLDGAIQLAELDLTLALADPGAPALTVSSVKAAEDVGALVDLPLPTEASITLNAGDTPLGAGTVATLVLGVPADAKGTYAINPVVVRARDTTGNEFVLATKPGTLTVDDGTVIPPPVTPGDLNGDGKVNVSDAILVLRAAVGLDTLTPDQIKTADVNGDGKVNVSDATQVLRKAVGLE